MFLRLTKPFFRILAANHASPPWRAIRCPECNHTNACNPLIQAVSSLFLHIHRPDIKKATSALKNRPDAAIRRTTSNIYPLMPPIPPWKCSPDVRSMSVSSLFVFRPLPPFLSCNRLSHRTFTVPPLLFVLLLFVLSPINLSIWNGFGKATVSKSKENIAF